MTSIDLKNVAKYYEGLPHQNQALEYLQGAIAEAALAEFAKRWRSVPAQLVTLTDLQVMTLYASDATLQTFLPILNAGFVKFQVNTPLRIAHFLAQVLHESGEFRYQEEIASGVAYEGRRDLGNTQPGDGTRFKGRGLIQVTGRYNYSQISNDLGTNFVSNPALLAQLPHCVNSAFWYWNSRKLNQYADRDDLRAITRLINGGYNGYDDRAAYLSRAKSRLLK